MTTTQTTETLTAPCDRREAAGLLPDQWDLLKRCVQRNGIESVRPRSDSIHTTANALRAAGLVTVEYPPFPQDPTRSFLSLQPTPEGRRVVDKIEGTNAYPD